MTVYRLKHVPTGLYFCPSRFVRIKSSDKKIEISVKSNLSKKGRMYTHKPSFRWIGDKYYNHMAYTDKEIAEYRHGLSRITANKLVPFVESEWVVEIVGENATGAVAA